MRPKILFRFLAHNQGFTLSEALCAAFIVLLTVSGLALSFIASVRTHRFGSHYYNAVCIARNRIQYARTLPFKDVAALQELRTPVTRDGDQVIVGSSAHRYERETIVTPALNNCWDITVRVYYPVTPNLMSDTPIVMRTLLSGQFDD